MRVDLTAVKPANIVTGLVTAWQYPVLSSLANKLIFLTLMAAVCVCRVYVGLVGSRLYSHDAFMLFDGAWRMLNGQRPHADFYSLVGFLTYVPTALGLMLSHGTAWGFGYGQALVGALLGVWAYLLGRRRLTDVPLTLLCMGVVLLVASPFPLGFSPMMISPSTVYSRQGYALLVLLVLESFQSRQSGKDFWGGISSGAIIGLLFFLKITYFAAAVFLLAALVPCRTQTAARWKGIVSGFAAVALGCCGYLRFQLAAMFHDLLLIGINKHIPIEWYLSDAIAQSAVLAMVFSLIAAFALVAQGQRRAALAATVMGVAVSLAGVMIIFGNFEPTGFPLTAFLAILILNSFGTAWRSKCSAPDVFQGSLLILGLVFIFGSLFSGAIGFAFAIAQRPVVIRRVKALDAATLNGFVPAGNDFVYGDFLDDGLALLRKYRRAGDTVMCLDFTNPFSYSLGMQPAPGGTTVLQYPAIFSDRSHLAGQYLFGMAKLVMVPKHFSDGSLEQNLDRIYGRYLHSQFVEVGESRQWTVYRQKSY